jgi:hypothetical protein
MPAHAISQAEQGTPPAIRGGEHFDVDFGSCVHCLYNPPSATHACADPPRPGGVGRKLRYLACAVHIACAVNRARAKEASRLGAPPRVVMRVCHPANRCRLAVALRQCATRSVRSLNCNTIARRASVRHEEHSRSTTGLPPIRSSGRLRRACRRHRTCEREHEQRHRSSAQAPGPIRAGRIYWPCSDSRSSRGGPKAVLACHSNGVAPCARRLSQAAPRPRVRIRKHAPKAAVAAFALVETRIGHHYKGETSDVVNECHRSNNLTSRLHSFHLLRE